MTTTATGTGPMDALLGRHIKDVIGEYPAVGATLAAAGIGCAACSVGTCRLKDVVGIHGLSEAQEQHLFTRIAAIVFPGQTVSLPRLDRAVAAPAAVPARWSPPFRELVEEHTVIKRVLALIPVISDRIADGLTEADKQVIAAVINFVRNFADRYHHAKEEDLLFRHFDGQADILKAMVSEHEIGRGHIRATEEALVRNDAATARLRLTAYGHLLTEHIRKEDEILYPWMDRELKDAQIGQLFAAFREVDGQFGDRPAHYRAWVASMETKQQDTGNPTHETNLRKEGGQ